MANATRVTGTDFRYYVCSAAMIEKGKYMNRTQAYTNLGNGYIKLTNPENPHCPYVFLRDPEHPELQADAEMLVSEDVYQAFTHPTTVQAKVGGHWEGDNYIKDYGPVQAAVFYMEEDNDLCFSFQFSARKQWSYVEEWSEKTKKTDQYSCTFATVVDSKNREIMLTPTSATPDGGYDTTLEIHGIYGETVAFSIYDLWFPNKFRTTNGITTDVRFLFIEGSTPYLNVPRSSRIRETFTGLDTNILFSSNAAQMNNANTTFTTALYSIEGENIDGFDPSGKTPVYTRTDTGTVASPLSHVTIPGDKLTTEGNYAAVISVTAGGQTLTAKVLLKVKQGPVKISLDKLDSYGVVKGSIPPIKYTLTSAAAGVEVKYTVQPSGEDVSEMKTATGGAISFDPGEFEGLKKAYAITVYARNKAEDPWSVDAMLLTVYNANPLKLILADVPLGKVGGATGGAAGNGSVELGQSYNMDNSDKIEARLFSSGDGAGYQVNYDFDTLRADVGLQRVISANYGSGAWGILSDRMRWTATEGTGENAVPSDDVTLNHKESGAYNDLRNYRYTSYIPTTDFLIVATDDVSEGAPVTVTATHAATGLQTSVNVTANTLENKLYLFRFNPKAQTDVIYTNGNGDTRQLKTNENGELAV